MLRHVLVPVGKVGFLVRVERFVGVHHLAREAGIVREERGGEGKLPLGGDDAGVLDVRNAEVVAVAGTRGVRLCEDPFPHE